MLAVAMQREKVRRMLVSLGLLYQTAIAGVPNAELCVAARKEEPSISQQGKLTDVRLVCLPAADSFS